MFSSHIIPKNMKARKNVMNYNFDDSITVCISYHIYNMTLFQNSALSSIFEINKVVTVELRKLLSACLCILCLF
jgi:hypothetical protein